MKSPDLPIACSLSAADLAARLTEMRRVGHASLIASEQAESQLSLLFRADPDTRDALRAIVAAEAECCAFLDLELDEQSEGIQLRIQAPPGAEPVLDDFLAAFARTPEAA